MKEMSMNLITQIIILATAVVGLIQVLRYKPKTENKNEAKMGKKESSKSGILEYFEPFFGILGLFAFMLAFPLFLFLFTKVISMIGSDNTKSIRTERKIEMTYFATDSLSIDSIINEKVLTSYYKGFYKTILTPSSTSKKDELTDSLVNICIERNELKLAAISTYNYSSTSAKDRALVRIIDKSIELENYEVGTYCISLFNSTSKQNSESEKLFYAISNGLKKKLNPTKNIVHLADSANNECDINKEMQK